jgi:hypothetical protein
MKYRTRTFYTETQKAVMWDRWRRGETLHNIALLFDRHHNSVRGTLAQTGGIRPAQRVRASRVLSASEREEISRGVVAGRSMRSIAASMVRAASTVSREIGHNGGSSGYRAYMADQAAWDQARRPKRCKLAQNREAAETVVTGTDRRLVEVRVSGRRELSGVTRDNLSKPVHPSPKPAEPCERSCCSTCGDTGRCGAPGVTLRRHRITAGSLTRSRSAIDHPR